MKNIIILCSNIVASGGTERAISNLINLYSKEKTVRFSIYSMCSAPGEDLNFCMYNAEIIHMNLGPLCQGFWGKIKWYIKAIHSLKRTVGIDADGIVLGYGHNMNILLPFIFPRRSYKIYGCEHINYDTIPLSSKIIMRIIYPYLTAIISLSSSAKKKLRHLNKHVYIIPNTVSFENAEPATLTNKTIVMCGRLSKEKGYERLLPIAGILKKEFPEWKINIYGEGELAVFLTQLYESNGLSSTVFLKGFTKNIQSVLRNSSMLFLTSYTEALPMIIIEAKAVGVPTIAYRNEGTETLVHTGIDGFVVDKADEFISNMKKLILNESYRQEIGLNAFNNAKFFTADAIKKEWDFLFKVH